VRSKNFECRPLEAAHGDGGAADPLETSPSSTLCYLAHARLIFRLRRSDHITDAPVSLHWLRVPERITYKAAVLTYRALTGDVPQYLRQFVRVPDVPSRHRLRSCTSDELIVPAVRLISIGSRAFPVVRAHIWNTLPLHVTSASSLTVFKRRLILHPICFSFPELSPV